MPARLKERCIETFCRIIEETSLLLVIAVVFLTIAVSVAVGVRTHLWYYGVITFLVLAAGVVMVIDRWSKIYRVFSIQDEEAENAQITQERLDNRLKTEEARGAANDPKRATYLSLCREELGAVPEDLKNKQFDLAWGRFHLVEETLLLLYEKEEVIAQLEIIATRAQELPAGKRDGVIKVLAQARDLLKSDSQLVAAHEAEFRAYLKEALAAINHHRRLFHWHRGIYQAQVYVLMVFIVPLLIAFFLLLRPAPPLATAASLRFLAQIFILGAIGGVVSLLLSERSVGEGVTSFYYGKIGLLIKPALGAVGAVIIYFLFESKLLFHVVDAAVTNNTSTTTTGVIKLAVTCAYFYYALAFLSGFSERFFTATLARLEGRFSEQGRT